MPTDNFESLSKKDLLASAKKRNLNASQLLSKSALIKLLRKAKRAVKSVSSRVRAGGHSAARRPVAAGATREQSRVADHKPYYEPTYHVESPAPSQAPAPPPQVTAAPPAMQSDLPFSYNVTKIVLMVRDPYWAFTYWDLSGETASQVRQAFQEQYGRMKPVLRVYDVTDIDFNGSNAHSHFDIDVSLEARNWYINLGTPNRSYLVDLGLLGADGNFRLIARSNVVRTPRDGPSDVIDDQWMAIDFDELYALSGGFGVGLSSGELRARRKKLFEKLISSPGRGWSGALASPVGKKEQEKRFFLEVATELIVYGRTHSDARLTVGGEPVRLRPDGTFSLRYYLPDGVKNLPVQAVSRDGDDTRKANIRVNKKTS